MNTFNAPQFGKQLLRFTFIAVFTYFSLMQFLQPDMWTSFVPSFLSSSAGTLVTVNALFEIICVVFLVFDKWTKWIAFLLGLHLLGIAATIGFNPIGMRDVGLALSLFSLTLLSWNDTKIS